MVMFNLSDQPCEPRVEIPPRPWWWRVLGVHWRRQGDLTGRFRGVAAFDHKRGLFIVAPLGLNLLWLVVARLHLVTKNPTWCVQPLSLRECELHSANEQLRRQLAAQRQATQMLARDVLHLEATAARWIVIEPVPGAGTCCVVKIERGDGTWSALEFVGTANDEPHRWRVEPQRYHEARAGGPPMVLGEGAMP